ncbi:hypothetical protein CASFOL_042618 [Castilleja foliolosa]|uniref:Dof zinc finger protein n=1 Tax=Castilleja foliolosa TaxID=1961234 RepID=A0ABD3B8K1_9LAMI
MISPQNKPPAGKDEAHISTARKTPTAAREPQEPAPKCPRCDSSNTKFCYYNNYSLTQPRHFCKTCRRYWTKGGAIRNVPIGGGCRKTKKIKPSPRLSGGSSDVGGLKFFQGISPAMDFQLGNLSNTCCAVSSNPCFNLAGTSSSQMGSKFEEMGSLNFQNGLTSSIESLSCINQDLHWKLQRQRLAMLFAGDNNYDNNNLPTSFETHVENEKAQPILFQGKLDGEYGNNISLSTEWFFDNSYATVNPTPATSGGDLNEDTNNWNIGTRGLY